MFKKRKNMTNQPQDISKQSGLWQKCKKCSNTIYNKELEEAFRVCPSCNFHYPLNVNERIQLLTDPGSFEEKYAQITPVDFLDFKYLDTSYKQKIKEAQDKTSLKDALVTGQASVNKIPINLAVMEFQFLGGSMGSVVGEKFARLALDALKNKNPFVVVSASGGARMQEGLTSLMQMAKTSAVIQRLKENAIPYIVILTSPTYGGVTASFAMLSDIAIAESNALIGFAGARVIEETMKQKLPEGFQSAEFLMSHGYIDIIANRKVLKNTLYKVLSYTYDK